MKIGFLGAGKMAQGILAAMSEGERKSVLLSCIWKLQTYRTIQYTGEYFPQAGQCIYYVRQTCSQNCRQAPFL